MNEENMSETIVDKSMEKSFDIDSKIDMMLGKGTENDFDAEAYIKHILE